MELGVPGWQICDDAVVSEILMFCDPVQSYLNRFANQCIQRFFAASAGRRIRYRKRYQATLEFDISCGEARYGAQMSNHIGMQVCVDAKCRVCGLDRIYVGGHIDKQQTSANISSLDSLRNRIVLFLHPSHFFLLLFRTYSYSISIDLQYIVFR